MWSDLQEEILFVVQEQPNETWVTRIALYVSRACLVAMGVLLLLWVLLEAGVW